MLSRFSAERLGLAGDYRKTTSNYCSAANLVHLFSSGARQAATCCVLCTVCCVLR